MHLNLKQFSMKDISGVINYIDGSCWKSRWAEDGATRQTSEKQYRLQRSNRLWSVSVIIFHECSRRVHLRFRVALIFSLSDQEIRLQTCTWQIQTLYCISGEDIKFLFNLAWHIPITPLHWTLGCPSPSFDPKDQAGNLQNTSTSVKKQKDEIRLY